MSKVEVNANGLESAIQAASKLTTALGNSSKSAKSLLSQVESSNWSGESRDSFIAYLSIVSIYHADLHSASKKQKKALKTLKQGMSDYDSHAEVGKVKSL